MTRVEINQPALDFEIDDLDGKPFHLTQVIKHGNLLLVFNRGFL